MTHLRAFIAIEFTDQIYDAIDQQIARLQTSLGDDLIRWVPAKNIHLTLKFLGETAVSHLDFIKQALSREADSRAPFDIQIGGFGCFPTLKQPRILWMGIHAPTNLVSLQKNIEDDAARLGYEMEARPFSPHLTLGRVKSSVSSADLQKIRAGLEHIQLGNIAIARVDSVCLFKSDLQNGGAIYTKLFSAPFRSKGL